MESAQMEEKVMNEETATPDTNKRVDPISRLEELNSKERLSTAERKEQKQLSNWGNSGMTRMEAYKLFNAALADIYKNVFRDIGRHGIRLAALERLLVSKGVFTMEEYEKTVGDIRQELMNKFSDAVLAEELAEAKNNADNTPVEMKEEAVTNNGGELKSCE